MSLSREAAIRLFVIVAVIFLIIVMMVLLPRGIERPLLPVGERGEPQFKFELSSFADLSGWALDDREAISSNDLRDILPVFLRSCSSLLKQGDTKPANPIEALGLDDKGVTTISGYVKDWQPACERAKALLDDAQNASYESNVKVFFETEFTPLKIINHYSDEDGPLKGEEDTEGLFTGYFEPIYKAASQQDEIYNAPVYARPADLIELDLGQFRKELSGTRIAGRVKGGRLHPYDDRRAINGGALMGKADILAWMDPNDLLFLQIQGSGKLIMEDEKVLRLGYAAQNGHPYTAIGKPLLERGEIPRDKISLQTIRNWLNVATKEEAKNLREENSSYVFFRELLNLPDPSLGPLGAQGVQLTPQRSLAADRRYHAMGTPVWLDIEGEIKAESFRRLMIIQDTGGAIRGPVRGDVYWGSGDEAKERAGIMKSRGTMTVLIPNKAAARALAAQQEAAKAQQKEVP